MKLHPIVEKIIEKRGLNIEELTDLSLDSLPPPHLIPGVNELKEELLSSIAWGDKIFIYGDYDFDGTSSSAILYHTILEMGGDVSCLISNRFRDGYGMSKKAIDIMKKNGVDLIITTDCGITEDDNINYAKSSGIEVFVCDHHNRGNKPKFKYIDLAVNQGNFPTNKLSAGGLAYFISKHLIGNKADKYLDLAGFSTIADLVDMTDKTNRILAHQGMNNIVNKGLKALMEVKQVNKVDEGKVGFSLAPCVNAVGRLSDNQLSFELFTNNKIKECYKLAEKANKINEKRKKMTENTVKIVESEIDTNYNIIVHQTNIERGLTGLVAGKLMDKYKVPVMLFGEDGKGSGRSLKPLNLQEELQNHKDVIAYANGHSAAFGCGLGDNDINELQERMYKMTDGINYQTVKSDMELNPDLVDDYLLASLQEIRPFGMIFPQIKLTYSTEKIDNIKGLSGNKHLKFTWFGIDCIWFNSSKEKLLNSKKIVYTPNYNEFMGRKSIQLMIKGVL